MSDWSDITNELDALGHLWDNEDIGSLVFTNRIKSRNRLGRFATEVSEAHNRATDAAGRYGARAMRLALADHTKTGALIGSVHYHNLGSRRGEISWGKGAPHWRYLAYGARRHPIKGSVKFWWENRGRMWYPGTNTIDHPGIHPVPFIQESYEAAQHELEAAMRREYALLR